VCVPIPGAKLGSKRCQKGNQQNKKPSKVNGEHEGAAIDVKRITLMFKAIQGTERN